MDQCPKCHYQRTAMDAQVNPDICPACGIVYRKWLARQQAAPEPTAIADTEEDEPRLSLSTRLRELMFYVPEQIDPATFWARALTLLGSALWGFYFINAGVDWEKIGGSFLHHVNLPFHEFGHVFFRPFGRFMTILGGSLFQVLMPLGLMVAFSWQQRDNFGASIMLWWCGQNFIDVSPYIDDAQYRSLPLVGGRGEDSHDWGNLLTMLNALSSTHKIAHTSFTIGAILILLALLWGFRILQLQKKHLSMQ